MDCRILKNGKCQITNSYNDSHQAVDILDEYIENHATGRKYKNHYAVMRTNNWVYQKVYQYKQTASIKRGELY